MFRGITRRFGTLFVLIGVVLLVLFFTGDAGGATDFRLMLVGAPLILVGFLLRRIGQRRRRFRLRRGRVLGPHDDPDSLND